MKNRAGKSQIKTFFTYDIIKVIAISAIVCLILTVLFNAVAQKPSEGQRFSIIYDNQLSLGDDYNLAIADAMDLDNDYGFSYDVLDFDVKKLTVADNSSPSYTLQTYVEIYDDDVLYCTDELASFYLINAYAQNFDTYIDGALNYLYDNGFYSQSGEINEQKIIDNFVSKFSKDNRFRKKDQLENGKQQEIKRIKALYYNAITLKRVIEAHPEMFSDKYSEYEWGENIVKGNFAIDLSKLTGGANSLEKAVKLKIDNDGEVSYTTENIYLMLGNNLDVNGHLHYEGLAYVISVLKCYTNWI